jgi:cation:H+ antiporter
MGIAAAGIVAGNRLPGLALGWVGVPGIIIFILYLLGMWRLSLSKNRLPEASPSTPALLYEAKSARTIWLKYALAAAAVIGAGIWLSFIGDEIAEVTRWGESFVGSLLLAITTSMPELVVAIAAFRLGAVDLALADILGANMLDISYIFILDLFYTSGPILYSASNSHLITAVVFAAMNIILILGLRFRQRRKTFFIMSWYGLLLVALYIGGAYALFNFGMVAG